MFPSFPSVPAVIPTDAQKAAFSYLKSGGPKFANPLSGDMSSISAGLTGADAFGGIGAPVGDLDSIIAQVTAIPGASADPALMQCVADINATSSSAGLSSLGDIGPSLDGAQSIIAVQSATVIPNMNTIISTASAYSSTAEMFGDQPSLCSGVGDLLGSLGGGATELMSGVKAAVTAVTEAFGVVGGAVKSAFGTVLSTAKAGIQLLIDAFVPGGSMDFSAITGFLNDVKIGVSTFVSGLASGLGKTIDEMKTMIGGVVADIKTGLNNLTTMISEEIAKLGQVLDYLKNAAMALSWPSLNPCAKEVMKNVCGAVPATPAFPKGAGDLVALVS